MENRTIILNLPAELIDKIDQFNTMDDRSLFISHIIEEKIKSLTEDGMDSSTELTTKMSDNFFGVTGEIDLINNKGISLGKFDIDTLEGFEDLAKKIQEVSKDPAVKIRARSFF